MEQSASFFSFVLFSYVVVGTLNGFMTCVYVSMCVYVCKHVCDVLRCVCVSVSIFLTTSLFFRQLLSSKSWFFLVIAVVGFNEMYVKKRPDCYVHSAVVAVDRLLFSEHTNRLRLHYYNCYNSSTPRRRRLLCEKDPPPPTPPTRRVEESPSKRKWTPMRAKAVVREGGPAAALNKVKKAALYIIQKYVLILHTGSTETKRKWDI